MVAWVDTPAGRTWAAGCGVIALLAGVIAVAAGVFISDPLKWVGVGVALLGAGTVAWAYVHPTRPGGPIPRSPACWSEKHDECAGSAPPERPCGCRCHFRSAG